MRTHTQLYIRSKCEFPKEILFKKFYKIEMLSLSKNSTFEESERGVKKVERGYLVCKEQKLKN